MKYSNLSLSELARRLTIHGLLDDSAIVNSSIAVVRRAASDRDELILAHYLVNGEKPYERGQGSYGELLFARESLTVAELMRRFGRAAEKKGVFQLADGFTAEIGSPASMELLPSTEPTKAARYLLEVPANNKGELGGLGPLINYGQLSYESTEQAVRAWIPLRPFHGQSDGRKGNVVVEVPLAAPRLGALTLPHDGLMRVAVEHVPRGVLPELTGVWQSNDSNQIEPFRQKVKGPMIDVVRPPWAERVALWLALPDSLVTDWYVEDAHRCTRNGRVLFPSERERSGSQTSVRAEIHGGENESVEFKPLMSFEPGKFDELIRTVIAFANKRGGTIYLGVSNHQEIIGVEKPLRELSTEHAKRSLEDCIKLYCSKARTRIADRIIGNVEFTFEAVPMAGVTVIRIAVAEGKQKPYSDFQTKDMWTRRGANTVKPDPNEVKELVTSKSRGNSLFDQV